MSQGYADQASPTDFNPRCWRCHRRLAEYLTKPYSVRCPRCKAENREGPIPSPPSPIVGSN